MGTEGRDVGDRRYLRWGQKEETLGIEGTVSTVRWGQKEETLGIEDIYVGDRWKGAGD